MKMLMKLLVAVYAVLALACIRPDGSGNKEIIRLFVNHYKVPCVGAGTQLCYLSREVTQSAWEFLFEGIDGFEYEWGKIYELEVEKTRRKNVKADQSTESYKLIRILSTKDAPSNESFPLRVKDADIVAIRKTDDGGFTLLGQYPVGCPITLCEELESKLQTSSTLTGFFHHSADHRSLILQSLEN